jgi:hypothetical protein
VTATATHQAGGSDSQTHDLASPSRASPTRRASACATCRGNPNTAIPLDITAGLGDQDGSETLTLALHRRARGESASSLGSDQGGGVWQIDNAQSLDLSTLT